MRLPRMRPLNWLLCALFALPACAEDSHRKAQDDDAGLRVRVIVVPVVLPPRHKDLGDDKPRTAPMVTYELSAPRSGVSLLRETRTMLVDGNPEKVRLTTIVPF